MHVHHICCCHSVLRLKSALYTNIVQNLLRAALVLVNVGVAIRAPYFGNMLSTVGGLTDAFLCFVMPPLIYRIALKGDLTFVQSGLYLAVVGWGFCVIFYTFYHVVELSMTSIVGNH